MSVPMGVRDLELGCCPRSFGWVRSADRTLAGVVPDGNLFGEDGAPELGAPV
ncbi:hypothetical protein ACLOJK_004416, partial [Asimina triloba]